MREANLRSIFSAILLGHLGVAASLGGCTASDTGDAGGPPGPSGAGGSAVEPNGSGGGGAGGSSGAAGGFGVSGFGGAGAGGAPISTAGFDAFDCSIMLADAAKALAVDSIELWHEGGASALESNGVPCEKATDQAACLAALAQARAEPWDGDLYQDATGFPRSPAQRLITTAGGVVATVDTRAALDALVTPVDSPEKLRIVVRYLPFDLGCQFVRRVEPNFELIGQVTVSVCPITRQRQLLSVSAAGEFTTLGAEAPGVGSGCVGRRPAGLRGQQVGSAGAVARYLERQAYLEGASVEAFERFARELEGFGAPPELAARARDAAGDEVRHHALVVSLGRRFDPSFACAAPSAEPAEARSLFAFALENAVEGCVRETWGALLAHHQAARAGDGAVRFVSALVADDETRHAELSWATHAWLLARLGEGERRAIEAAMARAADELMAELGSGDELGPEGRALLGLPSPAEALALVGRLRRALWAESLAA